MARRLSDRGPWACPHCGEVVGPPRVRKPPKYCIQCGRRFGPGPPIPRAHHREAPTPATIDSLAALIDLPHAAGRRVVIGLLDEMIAADLDREITELAGRSDLTREGIILALARRLEPSTAPATRDIHRENSGP